MKTNKKEAGLRTSLLHNETTPMKNRLLLHDLYSLSECVSVGLNRYEIQSCIKTAYIDLQFALCVLSVEYGLPGDAVHLHDGVNLTHVLQFNGQDPGGRIRVQEQLRFLHQANARNIIFEVIIVFKIIAFEKFNK